MKQNPSFSFQLKSNLHGEICKECQWMVEGLDVLNQMCEEAKIQQKQNSNSIIEFFVDNLHVETKNSILLIMQSIDEMLSQKIVTETINCNSEELIFIQKRLKKLKLPFEIKEIHLADCENNEMKLQMIPINSFIINDKANLSINQIPNPFLLDLNSIDLLWLNVDRLFLPYDEFGSQLMERNEIKKALKKIKQEKKPFGNQILETIVDEETKKELILCLGIWELEKEIIFGLENLFAVISTNKLQKNGQLRMAIALPTHFSTEIFLEAILNSLTKSMQIEGNMLAYPTVVKLICGKGNIANIENQFNEIMKVQKTKIEGKPIKIQQNIENQQMNNTMELKSEIKVSFHEFSSENFRQILKELKTSKKLIQKEDIDSSISNTLNLEQIKEIQQDIKFKQNIDFQITKEYNAITILLMGQHKTIRKKRSEIIHQIISLTKRKLKFNEFSIDLEISENDQPKYWEPMKHNYEEFNVGLNSQEGIEIINGFRQTVQNVNMIQITRIQNKELYANYLQKRRNLEKKLGNPNEMLLFHGTRQTDPSLIYKGKDCGFDMRLSRAGAWGIGAYFSYTAIYSATAQAQNSKNTGNLVMILARVLVGKPFQCPGNGSLTMPPTLAHDPTMRYDSVQGSPPYQNVFVIYDNNQAQPAYLLEYKIGLPPQLGIFQGNMANFMSKKRKY